MATQLLGINQHFPFIKQLEHRVLGTQPAKSLKAIVSVLTTITATHIQGAASTDPSPLLQGCLCLLGFCLEGTSVHPWKWPLTHIKHVSILTLGPLPERSLLCCCTFQTGTVSVLHGPSETERQTVLPSLSLSPGEWELVIQINTVADRLLFLQRQCFKEICFAVPIKHPLIKPAY